MFDDADRDLMRAFARYIDHANELAQSEQKAVLTPIGERVRDHLGVDPQSVPVVTEELPDHRLVDADIALEELAGDAPGALIGIAGDDSRFHSSVSEFIANPHMRWAPGPVSYADRATGPDATRRVVSFGLRLLTFDGSPIAVVQRSAKPEYGRSSATLELLGTDQDAAAAFLQRLRALMIERSVLRGQVLSFVRSEYGSDAGATFLRRPDIAGDDVVLADGVLDEVVDHVVGIGEQRDALLAAGQHLKRGVLLYGPPGTGKTLTIRHLLTRTPDVTAILLTGSSIAAIGSAAEIARTFQPSIVVLEDIDLVAMERHSSPQPLLFEVLDALDGLDGDADVAFVMTTNRVSVLERALADRPGRVDLAVEVPLPALPERVRLFRRYAGSLPFSDDALAEAAERADGTTGSFAKELMRRSVLGAALRGAQPADEDLRAALDSLLTERSALTRKLLGTRTGDGADDDEPDDDDDDDGEAFAAGEVGWVAVAPLSRTTFRPDGSIGTLATGIQYVDEEEDEDEDDGGTPRP
ncbi:MULTISPECIES: AAA family ATPase [unclassified Curtobacterium]|uniref:AAA family ATPase n=1 Tax=unclassified Curtobacterium TaxID=257496 RepID=UPI001047AF95|nr:MULTISPECIES: AAA family ATPase [unclassified Curtobacterium]TCL79113.1 ATPase family protein associated with various cellular activities (AAA) [Curtobacterium sp. PhB128]TCL97415.1 ATPase family protein associated with various cellular activities (AAA) [Curtobacterium sp. PhB138]